MKAPTIIGYELNVLKEGKWLDTYLGRTQCLPGYLISIFLKLSDGTTYEWMNEDRYIFSLYYGNKEAFHARMESNFIGAQVGFTAKFDRYGFRDTYGEQRGVWETWKYVAENAWRSDLYATREDAIREEALRYEYERLKDIECMKEALTVPSRTRQGYKE